MHFHNHILFEIDIRTHHHQNFRKNHKVSIYIEKIDISVVMVFAGLDGLTVKSLYLLLHQYSVYRTH